MYLRHVTLTSGHVRDSERSEISDEAIERAREMIEIGARPGKSALLSEVGPLYRLTAAASRWCCTCVVWQGDTRLVTLGIGLHSRCGSALWRHLIQTAQTPIAGSIDRRTPPAEPWLAARLEAGLALYPEASAWLGDLERCLGWAFQESRHG